MERNRKNTIIIIIALLISIIGLGIAFAAFSTTLTINGSASVEASSWNIVFEGTDGTNTIGAPTLTGSAEEVTHPTIKNNSTEIGNYSVSLATPGDSVTYNFRVHNKGDYAATISSLTIAGVTTSSAVKGANLVTDSAIATANANTLSVVEYRIYYTDNNILVGRGNAKDCLEPGETENISLRIVFSSTSATDTSILPSSNLTLDNLGISILYNQSNNGSCGFDPLKGITKTGEPFTNYRGAYYTYEGKRFIGTTVNNVIISENIIGKAKYSSTSGTDNGDGTYTFADHPAADLAASYCTGCRLMTFSENCLWVDKSSLLCKYYNYPTRIGTYNGSADNWWLADIDFLNYAFLVTNAGGNVNTSVTNSLGVRPVTDIPSSATITGAGTSTSPYVISQ